MIYPETRIESVTDTLSGLTFADPYRWLEQESEEVKCWQRAQSELASAYVRQWPQFDRLRRLVGQLSSDWYEWFGGHRSVPRYAAGRWFRARIANGVSRVQVVVSDEPMGNGRVLFDSMSERPERPSFVSWIAPSPDGRTLALGICSDGSENNTIRLIDVTTARTLIDPPTKILMDSFTGGIQWLPDSSGFFFSAIAGTAIEFEQRVYIHRRAPVPTTASIDIPWTQARDYRWVVVSADGRYAVAFERYAKPIPVAVTSLGHEPLRWRPFVTSIDGTVAGHVVGDRLIAVTDVGAPRGRVVAIELNAEDPDDFGSWQELVPESSAVLRTVTPVGQVLYLSEFVDTYSNVRIVDLAGKKNAELDLPGRGSLGLEWLFPMMGTLPKGHPEKFLFAFSSLTVSPGLYAHTPGEQSIETIQRPKVVIENAIVEDRCALSADGTQIPYHIVRRADVNASGPLPTLIYAYGGFNTPLVPQFPGPMAAFVIAGGMYVHAHLRGGGEFGLDWWRAGRMAKKQNCYDDLYAVAEDLIAAGRCTSKLLGVTGGSNGGLMAGVAATQRPDLWKVVVPRVPLLDLIGACRDPYDRWAIMSEFANIEEIDEVGRLVTFSPYHLVRDGVSYPAVFLDAGETDPRCPSWHAGKFAARLQKATAGNAPILLHVWESVGHGAATDKEVAATEHAEWLAFTLRHLGIDDWTP